MADDGVVERLDLLIATFNSPSRMTSTLHANGSAVTRHPRRS